MKTKKIKRYRLSVSRTFPKTHQRSGENTYFVYKALSSIYPNQTYYPVECTECGWKGWSHLAEGGAQIADTGDYSDIVCPKCGLSRLEDIAEDNLTYYKQNENVWPKLHTIRANYDLWSKRIAEVQRGDAIIELFYWSGKPYHKDANGIGQVVFATLDKDSGCGVQSYRIAEWEDEEGIERAGYCIDNRLKRLFRIEELAKNDGLSLDDFKEWFKPYDLSKPMAIIHFTKFRY